jgi:hypothetical protein
LSASAAWGGSVGENAADYFGVCVASAGDVNGDGYGDVIVGAEGYNSNQGKAYLFLGSATGLGAASAWPQAVGEAIGDKFGHTVASAGDVNNDGYGDVIVSSYGNNGSQGKTYLFLGSAFGLGSAIAWPQGAGLAASELYGYSVASAGDVNGDGFGDLLVGSPGYSVGLFGRGKAYLYLGNQSTGIRRTTQVLNAAASAPVAQGGTASFAIANSQFNLSTFKASPTGRTRAHLRVEVQPMGQAFDGNGVYYGLWQDTSPTAATVVSINGGLSPQTAYHWRARWFYEPAKAAYGWLHSAWFGPQAASLSGHYAVRTGPIVTASQTSTPTPTLTSTKTVTRTRTISPTLTRTPTITPSWTISPTASPTPTISQTFTFSPTVTQTSTVGPEGLGNTALAPVPVRPGQPLCAYFAEAPIRCRVDLYNLAGEKAAGADLGGENGPCMDTSHLAPGVYIARVTSEYSSGARSLWQKVAVIR